MAKGINRRGGVVGAVVTATLGIAVGCGNSFSNGDCHTSRTCAAVAGQPGVDDESDSGGDGAVAGGAGGAAAGGVAPVGGASDSEGGSGAEVPECASNSDCDDHLACNGVEACDERGHCISGKPPVCANSDTVNCSVACVEGATHYDCQVTANDADLDGHTSALCAKAPGDDCDDTENTVFPGAPELCDRLDNDCDKKLDLADGLSFTAQDHWVGRDVDNSIRAEGAVVAWSETSKLYGMFWKVRGLTDLVVALYDADGVRTAGPTTVGHSSAEPLAIAAGADGFGLVWNSDDSQESQFRSVNAKGELSEQVSLTGRPGSAYGSVGVAWSPSAKRWEVVADHGVASVNQAGIGQPFALTFDADLTIEKVEVVAAGDSFVIGLSGAVGSTASPRLYRHLATSSVAPAADQIAFDNPNHATSLHVASVDDGSFAAVAAAYVPRSSNVTIFDSAGKRQCGYVEPEVVSGLAGTTSGYTLALVALPTASSLREISASCAMGDLVPTTFTNPYQPKLAASPTSYCNLWTDDDGNAFYSIFGSNYCN